jgi:hypothetical protein
MKTRWTSSLNLNLRALWTSSLNLNLRAFFNDKPLTVYHADEKLKDTFGLGEIVWTDGTNAKVRWGNLPTEPPHYFSLASLRRCDASSD